jgi:hypothetical protein
VEHSFEDFNIITPDPHLLLHSNIPKPLHEVNPRTIKGRNWWDEQRRRIYSEQGDRCAACGVHKSQAKGKKKWLECHEIYEIDWKRGTAKFIKLIALCPYCHMFIHNGRMQALYDQGEISTRQTLLLSNMEQNFSIKLVLEVSGSIGMMLVIILQIGINGD